MPCAWRDADFERRIVHVRRAFTRANEGVPKSDRASAVPMVGQVARALDALSRRERFTGPGELVFANPTGGFLEDSALRRRYYRAPKAADIATTMIYVLACSTSASARGSRGRTSGVAGCLW